MYWKPEELVTGIPGEKGPMPGDMKCGCTGGVSGYALNTNPGIDGVIGGRPRIGDRGL